MSHSILRVARVKGSSNTNGIQRHNQRENKNYNNKDINHEETYKNYDLINPQIINYKDKIDETINANYAGNRKIRSDAIRHVDGLITSDKDFFNELSEEETEQFFKDSLEFLEDEYGKENMLYATVHLDERVPHMHFGFVPLTEDGRLSAKEQLGNKKDLTQLQDRFNSYVNNKGYELERGTSKEVTEREHKVMDQYKKDTVFHKQELQEVKDELKEAKERVQSEIKHVKGAKTLEYEDERTGLFSGREKTGRKIFSDTEFEKLEKTIAAAENVIDDYEKIKNTDYYKENQKLLSEKEEFKRKYLKADNELGEEKEERKNLRDLVNGYQDFTRDLYKTLREHVKGFERLYNNFKDRFLENDKTHEIGRFMEIVQDGVHMHDKKLEKQRTDDLEL